MRFFLIALLVFVACVQEPKEPKEPKYQSIWSWERGDKPYPTAEQLENGYIEVGWVAPGVPCTAKVIYWTKEEVDAVQKEWERRSRIFTVPDYSSCDSSQ